MKRRKILFAFFIIIIILSIISIMTYKSKGSDFLLAISSLSNDFIVIISFITIIYSLITYSIFMKEKLFNKGQNYHRYMAISLFMLLITMTIVFFTYATIFSHKNIFVYVIDTLVKNKNVEVLKVLFKALLIYYYIFLSTINGIVINYKFNNNDSVYALPITVILIGILLSIIIYFTYNSLFLIIFIFDILLYFIGSVFWKQKRIISRKR